MENHPEDIAKELKREKKALCEPISSGKIFFPAYFDQTSNDEVKTVQTGVLKSEYCKTSWIRPKLDTSNLNKVHFYNINRVEPPFWSCAIDSFLEICYVAICPHIEKLSKRNDFFSLVIDCLERYRSFLQNDDLKFPDIEYELAFIRQPIWDYIRQICPTFARRDCDASFSEIFSDRNFNSWTPAERNLFETKFDVTGTCKYCGHNLLVEGREIINFICSADLELLESLDEWQSLLNPMRNYKTLMCNLCKTVCKELNFNFLSAPKILLVELENIASERISFKEQIFAHNRKYILKGLVRHYGAHFTCAFSDDNSKSWNFVDDLQEDILQFANLNQILNSNKGSWFFSIYVFDENSSHDGIDFDIAKNVDSIINTRKRKVCTEKDYPLRSKFLKRYETEVQSCVKNEKQNDTKKREKSAKSKKSQNQKNHVHFFGVFYPSMDSIWVRYQTKGLKNWIVLQSTRYQKFRRSGCGI